ncbi:MAG: hypothetical protein V2B18_20835 [Pseudomonadota bacterium]
MIREDQNLPESENRGFLLSKETSELGHKLRSIRREFVATGGRLLTREELSDEIAERRGGTYRITHEDENLR